MGIISVFGGVSDGPEQWDRYVTLTLDPVNGVGLQGVVSQLKNLPQVRRYPAQLEGRAVNEFVHVVKQICNPIKLFMILVVEVGENYR